MARTARRNAWNILTALLMGTVMLTGCASLCTLFTHVRTRITHPHPHTHTHTSIRHRRTHSAYTHTTIHACMNSCTHACICTYIHVCVLCRPHLSSMCNASVLDRMSPAMAYARVCMCVLGVCACIRVCTCVNNVHNEAQPVSIAVPISNAGNMYHAFLAIPGREIFY